MERLVASMLILVGIAGIASACNHMGSCPNPPVQEDFDIQRYMGKWFEYVHFPNAFEQNSKCVTANYTLNPDGSVVVLNGAIQEVRNSRGACPWYTSNVIKGDAIVMDKNEPAKLGVRFRDETRGKYWVLETDYVTYAVVYGCTKYYESIPFYYEVAWVLTRDRGVAPPGLTEIYKRMTEQGIDVSQFLLGDQKNCPLWPKE